MNFSSYFPWEPLHFAYICHSIPTGWHMPAACAILKISSCGTLIFTSRCGCEWHAHKAEVFTKPSTYTLKDNGSSTELFYHLKPVEMRPTDEWLTSRDSGGCSHHHVCLFLIKVGRSGWGTCLVQKQFNSISETNKHLAATKRGLHHSFAHTSLVATGNRCTLESPAFAWLFGVPAQLMNLAALFLWQVPELVQVYGRDSFSSSQLTDLLRLIIKLMPGKESVNHIHVPYCWGSRKCTPAVCRVTLPQFFSETWPYQVSFNL